MGKLVRTQKPLELGEDDRGSTHELDARETPKYLLAYRKKGAVSGNHYHAGVSAGKNPEQLLLISGEAQLDVEDLASGKSESLTLEAPVLVEIPAHVIHTVTALTDISFLEFNSLEEHQRDTHRSDS